MVVEVRKTGGACAPPRRRRSGMKTTKLASIVAILAALFFTGTAFAQTDPGVRSNTGVNAGQPFASVTASPNDLPFFQTGLAQFDEHQTVTGDNPGLGPRFNLDSCGACHSQPAPCAKRVSRSSLTNSAMPTTTRPMGSGRPVYGYRPR